MQEIYSRNCRQAGISPNKQLQTQIRNNETNINLSGISSQDMAPILQTLQKMRLQGLTLSDCSFKYENLIQCLSISKILSEFRLEKCEMSFSPKVLDEICISLPHSLQNLAVVYCKIGDNFVKALAGSINNLPNLQRIELDGNKFSYVPFKQLFSNLIGRRLELSLQRCGLTSQFQNVLNDYSNKLELIVELGEQQQQKPVYVTQVRSSQVPSVHNISTQPLHQNVKEIKIDTSDIELKASSIQIQPQQYPQKSITPVHKQHFQDSYTPFVAQTETIQPTQGVSQLQQADIQNYSRSFMIILQNAKNARKPPDDQQLGALFEILVEMIQYLQDLNTQNQSYFSQSLSCVNQYQKQCESFEKELQKLVDRLNTPSIDERTYVLQQQECNTNKKLLVEQNVQIERMNRELAEKDRQIAELMQVTEPDIELQDWKAKHIMFLQQKLQQQFNNVQDKRIVLQQLIQDFQKKSQPQLADY